MRIEAPAHGVTTTLLAYAAIPQGILSDAGRIVFAVATAALSTVVSTLIQNRMKKHGRSENR